MNNITLKLLKLIVLAVAVIFAILLILPSFANQDNIKSNLEKALDDKIDGDFTIKGSVEISFLPEPTILINQPSLKNAKYQDNFLNLDAGAMSIKLSILSLFSDIKIKELKLKNPVMELSMVDTTKPVLDANQNPLEKTVDPNNPKAPELNTKDTKTQKLPTKKAQNQAAGMLDKIFDFKRHKNVFELSKIEEVSVKKGRFIKLGIGGKKDVILDLKDINFSVLHGSNGKNLDVDGDIIFNEVPTQFALEINMKNNEDSKININSPLIKLDISGQFSDSNINDIVRSSFNGKVNGEILNPKEFANKYLSAYSLIHGKINNSTPLKISASIKSTKGNYQINNISIKSQVVNGKGQVNADLSKTNNSIINSKIDIENADIDAIWASRSIGESEEALNLQRNIMEDFINGRIIFDQRKSIIVDKAENVESPIFQNITLDSQFKIKKARYSNQFLNDVEINLSISQNGDLEVKNTKMKGPDGSNIEISGAFKNSNNIPNFTGQYQVNGSDFSNFLSWIDLKSKIVNITNKIPYNISGEIIALPSFLALKNLKMEINGGKNTINGDIRYNNDKDLEKVEFKLNLNELNISDYFNISFDRNTYLAPGEFLKKLLWLNTISSENHFNINIGKLQFNDNIFLEQNLNFKVAPGLFEIPELILKTDNKDFYSKISLLTDIRVNEKLDFNLEINNFDYKTGDFEDNKKFSRLPFYSRFFLLPTLSGFDGKITIKSSKLIINSTEFNDIFLSGKLEDGLWNIKDGQLKAYDGIFQYNGDVVLRSTKSINGSIIGTEINNRPFLEDLLNMKNMSGISNISGIFTAHGTDLKSFIQSATTKMQFFSGNVTVDNFGIGELFKRTLIITYADTDLSDPASILFNKNYSTTFKEVKGIVEIDPLNKKNQVKISASTTGINNVTNGSIDLYNQSFGGVSQIVFVTGTKSKQIPITILISHRGLLSDIANNPNLDQVNQYVSSFSKTQSQ